MKDEINEGENFLVSLKFKHFGWVLKNFVLFCFVWLDLVYKKISSKHYVLDEFQYWCTQTRYISMNCHWCDYILVLTVLILVVAESGENAALALAQAKFGICSTHGVQSAGPHLLSHLPVCHAAAASCLQVLLCSWSHRSFYWTPVQPLGFKRTTARIYSWASVQWHLLAFLFSLLLYDPSDVLQ